MLDDLSRDTFNLLGLAIASLGLVALASAKLTESWIYIFLLLTSLIGTIMFSILSARGSILLIKRGLNLYKLKKESQKKPQIDSSKNSI
jgi:hypothetical protein